MADETSRDSDEANAKLFRAKIAEAAQVMQQKNVRLEAAKAKFTREGLTLRDTDMHVVNISVRMPAAAALFGEARLIIGGGAVPDPPRADTDPRDHVFADNDPIFPIDRDLSDNI